MLLAVFFDGFTEPLGDLFADSIKVPCRLSPRAWLYIRCVGPFSEHQVLPTFKHLD